MSTGAKGQKPAFVDAPKLQLARGGRSPAKPRYDQAKKYAFRYDNKAQREQPHIVKFSGGRSSGMLLVALLESNLLNAARGDVVVFNNTSAEHPATYDFAEKCKKVAEEKYGIPFFWIEFQTYEDAAGGDWRRFPAYRLVNTAPFSEKNPNGYHSRGEVFEELLSWKRFLPTRFQRICTQEMKIAVTQEFLRDWFARKPGIERLGHWYDGSMLDDETVIRLHEKHGGKTPPDILLEKAAYVRSRPHVRPEQKYADYSAYCRDIVNDALNGKSFGDKVSLSGADAVDYVTFVGFRADEPARVARMCARNYGDSDCDGGGDPHSDTPEGEYVYAPLASMGVTKEDVAGFWRKQNWDLRLPDDSNMSNCVFCFLKGSQNLVKIISTQDKVNGKLPAKLRPPPNTPGDVKWWMAMEKKYGRDILKEKRVVVNAETMGERPIIGFWGADGRGLSYERLSQAKMSPDAMRAVIQGDTALPCDCTD